MRIIKEKNTRLVEMSYTVAIWQLPSYTNLVGRSDKKSAIEFLKKEWPKTKENYGVKTVKELIHIEINNLPTPKKVYNSLSAQDKEDFWKRVEFIDNILTNS